MMEYHIKLLKQAEKDFYTYVSHISIQYGMPITALKHYEEISAVINSLKTNPERYTIRQSMSLQRQYGTNVGLLSGAEVRRANYKKMAIIYTIIGSTVYVHRIIAASMIVD